MYAENPAEVARWRDVLDLCKLRPDEAVCVLTGAASDQRNLASAMRAVQERGCPALQLHIPGRLPVSNAGGSDRNTMVGVTPITGNQAAIDALKGADLVVDLMGLLHSKEQLEILGSGTRMLMVLEPADVLARLLPVEDDKRRVMACDTRLRSAKTMRISSKAGTDITFPIGQFGTVPEYGFADEPGHWDHWPSGFNSTWPNENEGDGQVVIDVGDLLFPFKIYVTSQIRLTIRSGVIDRIDGGFEAEYLKEYMQNYNDPGAYHVSHIGYGLQPKAKWTALMMQHDRSKTLGMDGRAFYGNFLFSTGPNSEVGGSNHSQCHIDIPMRNCSVFLDNEPMVVDGDVIAADQRVDRAGVIAR